MPNFLIKKIWFKSIPVIILFFLMIAYLLPSSKCMSILYFNFKCAFCGGTRSYMLFHKLNWTESLLYNPFVFICLIFFWGLGILALVSSLNNWISKKFDRLFRFLNNNFFIVFGSFIFLYFIQTFVRIIYN